MKNKGWAFLLLLMALSPLLWAAGTSLSDFSTDGFDQQKETTAPRNPFVPGAAEQNDASLFSLDGIIIGPQTKLALISGKTLEIGQGIGSFILTDVAPGHVTLQSVEGATTLSLSSYLPKPSAGSDQFEISFQGADIKDALNMIASAGNFNIMLPETLGGRVTLTFRQTSLKEAMGSILRVNGLEFAEEGDIVRVGKQEDFASGSYFNTEQIGLQYASAKDLVEAIKSHLSEKGTVTAEKRTNTLIIKDSQTVIDNIRMLVQLLDKQDTQVRIEAKIVDVTRTFSRSLGIQWGFAKDTGQVQGFGATGAGNLPGTTTPANFNFPALSPTSGVGVLVGNLFSNTDLNAQITAAEAKGDAHIISQPSITTVNNAPAKIRSGLKIFVKTTSTIAVGGSGGGASGEDSGLKEIDTGIELTVTPQITSVNTVKMKIDAVESEADFTRTVDGIPSVIDNTASTTVLVRDGETTVIGGLMKIKKSNSRQGVPFINNIPIVGWFFSNKTRSKTDNELLVFITPHLVKETRAFAPETETAEVAPIVVQEKTPPPIKHSKHYYKLFRKK